MSHLPNHLIMLIIKFADGGLHAHKSKARTMLTHINSLQSYRTATLSIKTSLYMGAVACGERSIHHIGLWSKILRNSNSDIAARLVETWGILNPGHNMQRIGNN
tara:strand:- start:1415 stop:1726 length:312 start_codon:yes stop_codon:yes gene_type:complete